MRRPWHTALIPCLAAAVGLLTYGSDQALAARKPGHKAERKNMRLVGHDPLQARSAYQPIIHFQNGRWIAYVGHHNGTAFNPLTGQTETNGVSIVDVTTPANPVYLHHLPGVAGAQMVRACNGSDLPGGDPNKVYLLRSNGNLEHQVWDVTNPRSPTLVSTPVTGLDGTHKNWWECDTGIAYLVSGVPGWRTNRMTQIFDLSNPAAPVFIRNYGLVGQQPGSSGPVPQSLHGPISIGPAGNRVYFGHGTGSNGILQIVDRAKLLDPSLCPTPPSPAWQTNPTEADLLCPQIGRLDTSPTMGAHTVFPVLQLSVPEFAKQAQGNVRDFVILVNEAGGNTAADICPNNRQLIYIVDVTRAPIGNLAPNETRPMSIAGFQVPEASGNFCDRGGRFGAHASNENFTPIYYGRLVFVSWFNAGVRAIDIREPWSPREAAYFIPATTANTDERCATRVIDGVPTEICKIAIQTNNVEVDDRGLIYLADRANTGLHIVELTGKARRIADLPGGRDDDDDDDD